MRSAIVFAALFVSVAAHAETRRVDRLAVLPIIIEGPHGKASLSSVIDDVSAASSFRLGLKLISNEEMFVASSGDLSAKVRDCGSDTSCIADRLRAFDARYGLVVVLNLAVSPPLLSLQLLDTDERRMVGESIGELGPGENVSQAIRTRAAQLFDQAGWGQAGRIIVDVAPGRAKINLADRTPDEGTSNVFTVPPGRYEVKAEADGHRAGQTEAVAIAGQETRVGLTLEEESSLLGSPWFWGVVGVAVAGGTTAAIIATRPKTRCLCIMINGVGCELCEQ